MPAGRLLPGAVGPHKAKELAFFGDDLLAEDAAAPRHRQQVAPAEELEATLTAWPAASSRAQPGPSPRPSG